MRITRDKLIKFAETAVAQEVYRNHNLVCVYLTGSLLHEDPLLGGTTDIDLVLVHNDEPNQSREVRRITEEVTLDIAHVSQNIFRQPRHLRVDPWWGSFMCLNPIVLYETQHWFEFTQASVCSQFGLAENILQRARPLAESARQGWSALEMEGSISSPSSFLTYLRALQDASNAIACLSGSPLTMRRFMLDLPQRAEAISRPGLASGFVDLFTSGETIGEFRTNWFQDWTTALSNSGKLAGCPQGLLPHRISYYTRAAGALWEENLPAAIWILLNTWAKAIQILPADSPLVPTWQKVLDQLGLSAGETGNRLNALDSYLDNIEETLDMWAQNNGVLEQELR
jgi:hypothetical protein